MSRAMIMAALLSGGCAMTDPYSVPPCSFVPTESVAVDELWNGARPLDGLDRLDGMHGDWSTFGDDGQPVTIDLRATAEPTDVARVYRHVHDQTGEACGSQTRLGVPMRLTFASPDQAWSLSGDVVYFYSDDFAGSGDSGWAFDFDHKGSLDAVTVDPDVVGDRVGAACSDTLAASLHGSHWDMPDGSRVLTIWVQALCDGRWWKGVLGGTWTVGPPDDTGSD